MRNLEVVTAPRSMLTHIQVLDGVAGQRWASQIVMSTKLAQIEGH